MLSPTETPAAGDGMMTGVGTEKNTASATFAPVHESVWCLGCLDVAMKPPVELG